MGDISTEDLTFLVHDIARWILLLVSWSLAAALSKYSLIHITCDSHLKDQKLSSSKTRRQSWFICKSWTRNN